MNNLTIDAVVWLCIIIIVLVILHKYGAEILTGLGAAALAKSLLGSSIIAPPAAGSSAEKDISDETAATEGAAATDAATTTESAGAAAAGDAATGAAAATEGEAVAPGLLETILANPETLLVL